MLHRFRKYTSNRGSALFMVISTMTALLISIMAMFFSMNSARQTQYAVFSEMQAEQSAKSIGEILKANIAPRVIDNWLHHTTDELATQINNLPVGGQISSGANGFKSLDPNNAALSGIDESQLGAYTVTISRLEDDGTDKCFDIMVVTSVDGKKDVYHYQFKPIMNSTTSGSSATPPSGKAELFSATGYVANDAYLNGGYYLTNVFYDTQKTYMCAFGSSGESRIGYNLGTGGDLYIGANAMTLVKDGEGKSDAISAADFEKIGAVTWGIRGNLRMEANSNYEFRPGSEIFIGGNMDYRGAFFTNKPKNGDTNPEPISVYINGDLIVNGWLQNLSNVNIYINGSLIIESGGINFSDSSKFFMTDSTKVYAPNEQIYQGQTEPSVVTNIKNRVQTWDATQTGFPGYSQDKAFKEKLDKLTTPQVYSKWELSPVTNGATKINIALDASNPSYYICANKNTAFASRVTTQGGTENGIVGDETKTVNAFEIENITVDTSSDKPRAIIIDTGDDPKNIVVLKLNGNYGTPDAMGKKPIFMWFPENPNSQLKDKGGRAVLIKGQGIVLIEVPEGTTYQDCTDQITAHYSWWKLMGGVEQDVGNGRTAYNSKNMIQEKVSHKIVSCIHKQCVAGDGCTCTRVDSTEKCSLHNVNLKTIHCDIHGDVATYCPDCESDDSEYKTEDEGWCANHVDKTAYENNFYNTLSNEEKANVQLKNGGIDYPTVNFFLVSCDENADMRFAKAVDQSSIDHNMFFGFVYAPYITFKAKGGSLMGVVKLCGGLTVSDYNIEGIDSYIGCYPEMMPQKIAALGGGNYDVGTGLSSTTKTWRIEFD